MTSDKESAPILDFTPSAIEGFADIKVKQNDKEITLHSYKFPAKTPEVKAVNLIMQELVFNYSHGYGEHANGVLTVYANYFASQGICSIGIDQRGFGKSEGIPG